MRAYRNVPVYPPGMFAQTGCQNPFTLGKLQAPLNKGCDEPLTLTTFVSKYAQSLPLRITVEKGHHSIATGDTYEVHYVKHNQAALLQDASGMTHTISLNSAVQFAPVFDPNNNPKKAMCGFVFEQISDIIAQKSLPKVIRATKSHVNEDCKSSVEENEMFLVQKTVFTTTRKKALQVYSVTKGEQKLLEGSCLGGFTTDPRTNCLHLLKIIEHFSHQLPLDVLVILGDSSKPEDLPYNITSEVSSLTGFKMETFIVASPSLRGGETVQEGEQDLVDIPVVYPIQVRIVQPKDGMKTYLTKQHSEIFDPSTLQSTKIRSQDRPGTQFSPSPKPLVNRQQKSYRGEMRCNLRKDSGPEGEHDSHVYQSLHKQTQDQSHSYETVGRSIDSKTPTKHSGEGGGNTMTMPLSTSISDTSRDFGKLLSRMEMLERQVNTLCLEVEKLKSKGMYQYTQQYRCLLC